MGNLSDARYADLPLLAADRDERHAWEHWGAGDPLGTLNRITPDVRRDAVATVRTGETINLDLPLDEPYPTLFGRRPYRHTFSGPSQRNFIDDRIDDLFPQASTQWDGFRHLVIPGHGWFGGVQIDFETDRDTLGIQHWASGIIGRGVLVDVSERTLAALTDDPSKPIDPIEADELQAAIDATGEPLRAGDILCVRTGWMQYYHGADAAEREAVAGRFTWPGLSGSSDMAQLLWDSGFAAVAADNPGVEAAPGRRGSGTLHRRALALLGMPFGELFDFDALAVALHAQNRASFLFMAVPLNIPGGVGSTGNAVAML
ncbi:cyclase family protein [Microbacterium sp. zg-Y818]|uniref:cyclase family protein n=1 Tax=unclassified Microbacterium TaxID=2609290 RepID=UPI00214CFF37|nr:MULTISPECIES: cyclase family protein [unclassified Microbacterium]MCR2799299.1 cyclase family protein [Microbacterium sp. zg.Y818]WIM21300.1 cyclase family protein [Microbacterium sp. zg-Y818]